MQIPVVNKEEAKKFSGIWNFKGVAIVLDDVHCQFASDFANVVLKSFVQKLIQEQAEAAKPKIQLAEN
jgi:hypothetical protein